MNRDRYREIDSLIDGLRWNIIVRKIKRFTIRLIFKVLTSKKKIPFIPHFFSNLRLRETNILFFLKEF